jgi:hypothetical protein
MSKKVPSPTGRPSRISKGNQQALKKFAAGKPTGGKRPTATKATKPKSITRAQKMDRGMALSPTKKRARKR